MAQVTLPQSIDAATPAVASEVQDNFVALRNAINGDIEGGTGNNLKANGVTAREVADAIHLRGVPGGVMQEGVYGTGDLKVTPGSGLVLNYASGLAWITDDSGVVASGALLPANIVGSSVTIAANASGNPRIDQIVVTLSDYNTGTVSIVQGTATAGATLDNRTGAAALPAGAVRLADILMPNGFAGPFVQNTHIRDRRPWARGAHQRLVTTINHSDGVAGWQDVSNMALVRLELSGVPVIAHFFARTLASNSGFDHTIRLQVDGSADAVPVNGELQQTVGYNGSSPTVALGGEMTGLSAGSHTFKLRVNHASGSGTLTIFAPLYLEIWEDLRNVGDNAGA